MKKLKNTKCPALTDKMSDNLLNSKTMPNCDHFHFRQEEEEEEEEKQEDDRGAEQVQAGLGQRCQEDGQGDDSLQLQQSWALEVFLLKFFNNKK